jgi:hypothetical protein
MLQKTQKNTEKCGSTLGTITKNLMPKVQAVVQMDVRAAVRHVLKLAQTMHQHMLKPRTKWLAVYGGLSVTATVSQVIQEFRKLRKFRNQILRIPVVLRPPFVLRLSAQICRPAAMLAAGWRRCQPPAMLGQWARRTTQLDVGAQRASYI